MTGNGEVSAPPAIYSGPKDKHKTGCRGSRGMKKTIPGIPLLSIYLCELNDMPEIRSAGYSVFITKSIAREINRFFRLREKPYSKIFILVDENSLRHCYPRLVEQIEYFKEAELIEI